MLADEVLSHRRRPWLASDWNSRGSPIALREAVALRRKLAAAPRGREPFGQVAALVATGNLDEAADRAKETGLWAIEADTRLLAGGSSSSRADTRRRTSSSRRRFPSTAPLARRTSFERPKRSWLHRHDRRRPRLRGVARDGLNVKRALKAALQCHGSRLALRNFGGPGGLRRRKDRGLSRATRPRCRGRSKR